MEETRFEAEKHFQTPNAFGPHSRRRRHLKSGTYRTWVRILSHCYDELPHSVSVDQNAPQALNQDNGSNELVQETKNEVQENVEIVGPDSMKPKNSAAQEERVADENSCDASGFRGNMEQIESLLNGDENVDFSKMDIDNILAIDLQDLGLDPEQMLMDEPEWMAKGNEDSTPKPSATLLDQNQSGSDKVALLTKPEEHSITVRSENAVQMVSGTLDSSLNTVVMGESSNQREPNEHGDSLLKASTLDLEPIVQQNAIEPETSVSAGGGKESFISMNEVGAIKEPQNFNHEVPEAVDFSLNKDMVAEASNPTEYSKDKSSSGEPNYLEVEREMLQKDKELEKIDCICTGMNSPNHMNDGDIEEGEISGDEGRDDRSMDILLGDTVVLEENNVPEVQISKDVIDREEHPCKDANDKDFGANSFLGDMVDEGTFGIGVELSGSSRTAMIRRPAVVEGKNLNAIRVDESNPLLEGGRIGMKDYGFRVGNGCPAVGNHGTTTEEKWDDGASKKRKRGPPTKEKKERKKAKERKKRAEKNRELGVKRLKLHPIQKTKTLEYCRHYMKGRCREGDKCNFSHDTEPLTKSKPCLHLAIQSCLKGDSCPYDHELSKYPCKNFEANGFCKRGDRCLFSHKIPSKEDSETAACKPELKPPMVQSNSRSQQVNIGGASQQNVHALAYSTGIHSRNNTKLNVTQTVLKQPELATKGISFPSIAKSSLVHSTMHKQGGLSPNRNTGAKVGNQIDQLPLRSVTPPVTTPKGINFLSFGKASPDNASKSQFSHQTSPRVSEIVQNLDGMLKANKLAVSQGTSFNPFGKSSVASSSSDENLNRMLQANQPAASQGTSFNPFGKSSVASCSGDQNLNRMLQANHLAESQGTSFNPFGKSSIGSSSSEQHLNEIVQANQPAALQGTSFNPFGKSSVATCGGDQNLNGMLQANQLAASQETSLNPFGKSSVASSSSEQNLNGIVSALQGTSFNPFEKSSVSSSSSEKPVSLPFCWDNSSNRDSRESQNTADKPQDSSAISLELPSSPRTSGQSSDRIASRFGTPNSFQRGLFSTLAFAAKYKTQNMNQSIGSTGTQVGQKTRNSSISDRFAE